MLNVMLCICNNSIYSLLANNIFKYNYKCKYKYPRGLILIGL